MKIFRKILCMMICCAVCAMLTACKPKPIELNIQNINQYLNMSMIYDDDSYYESYDYFVASHSINVVYSTKAIKKGSFEDVVITIEYTTPSNYEADSDDYAYVDMDTLNMKCSIPYDGQFNEIHNIHANSFGGVYFQKPTELCNWKIVSVSGRFYPEN